MKRYLSLWRMAFAVVSLAVIWGAAYRTDAAAHSNITAIPAEPAAAMKETAEELVRSLPLQIEGTAVPKEESEQRPEVLVPEEPTAEKMTAVVSDDTGSTSSDPAERVLELVNHYRVSSGLASLTLDSDLCRAAGIRAEEITRSFSHSRPDGSSWFTVSALACAENIAMGTGMDADSVMSSWMDSAGHRENILDGSYATLGVGCYWYGSDVYWVQLFGR